MGDKLTELVDAIATAAADGEPDAETVDLFGWCRTDLLPHVKACDEALLSAARAEASTAPLAEALAADHRLLRSAADGLDGIGDAMAAVTTAATVKAAFDLHVEHVERILLPALTAARIDLAPLAEEQPVLVGGRRPPPKAGATVSRDRGAGEVADPPTGQGG